ncbi:hypothetical protein D3C81_2100910 [compost metagenome]
MIAAAERGGALLPHVDTVENTRKARAVLQNAGAAGTMGKGEAPRQQICISERIHLLAVPEPSYGIKLMVLGWIGSR